MNNFTKLFTSSVGKKFLMAASGLILFLFVVGHLIGNLQVFLKPEAINRYAFFLQSNLELLWPVRIILLLMVALHIWTAVALSLDNKAARPERYAIATPYGATLASRTMLVSGLIAGAFIIYHLLHYTVIVQTISGTSVPLADLKEPETGHHDVYAMMVAGFSVWYVSLFYAIGIALLCLHLSHGTSAMFQSLGWKNHLYGPAIDKAARVVAVILCIGYLSIPASILLLGHGKDYLSRIAKAAAVEKGVKEVR